MILPEYLNNFLITYIVQIADIIKVILFPAVILSSIPFLVWVERRGSAFIQDRYGPNRASVLGFRFFGFFHLIADAIKFFLKECFVPQGANIFYYFIAPVIVVMTSILSFAVIPVSSSIEIFSKEIHLQIANIDGGILYIFAISSLGVIGIILAGWSSNNKFALLGSLRAASQMLSYELPLGLSVIGAILIYGTVEPLEMIRYQEGLLFGFIPKWGILLQPLGFILLIIAGFAECNRLPFDLPEGESEIVAGYHTEYGAMKFSMFMMAEYVSIITISSLIVTVFFGGYTIPWINSSAIIAGIGLIPAAVIHLLVFSIKTGFFIFLFVWVRWTLPRFRYDQVMNLGWKKLIPIGIFNIVITTFLMMIPGFLR